MRRARRGRPFLILTLVFVVAGAAWGGCLARLHLAGEATALDRLEALSLDMRTRMAGPRRPPDDPVIVAVDDETIRSVGTFPLSRGVIADVIAATARAGPRAVAVDFLFLEESGPGEDRALADALAQSPSVIGAAAVFPAGDATAALVGTAAPTVDLGLGPIPRAQSISWPAGLFLARARPGLVNVAVDATGTPRHVPLLVATGDGLAPGFALVAAATASGAEPQFSDDAVTLGESRQPLDLGRYLALNFYGPEGTIPTVSAARVLAGEPTALAALAGKTAIIGTTALGSGDSYPTPFDDNVPGVEVLATAVANLMTGGGLVRDTAIRRLDAVAMTALPMVVVLLMAIGSPAVGLALAAVVTIAWLVTAQLAFDAGIWLNAALPLAAAVPTAVAYGVARYLVEHRIAARLGETRAALERLQSPLIADQLTDPEFLAEPAACDAAVLFLDLSGFTGLSERLGPAATRSFLKGFHERVGASVTARDGLIVAFMGDGAMIVFGFPVRRGDEAERALASLRELAGEIGRFIADAAPRTAMAVRFGLHFGPVVVSRLGADAQQHITATGDTVNVASRLLEIAKANRAQAAVGETVFSSVPAKRRAAAEEGFGLPRTVAVRGRAGGVAVRFATDATRLPAI